MKNKVNILHRWSKRLCIRDITTHDLHSLCDEFLCILYRQYQRPQLLSTLLQLFYQMSTEQAGGSRNQYFHALLWVYRTLWTYRCTIKNKVYLFSMQRGKTIF